MATASDPVVTRPPLAFRIGVTGARHLSPDVVERLRTAAADILSKVKSELFRLADDERAKTVYGPSPSGAPAYLRLVSPLAEGADRIVAEAGLEAGFELYAPLPFAQSEYENDFPQSVEAFRALLKQAQTLELDGARAFADQSYREVGRFVVRNCDLLIAIWDGAPERGVGGAGEIVQFAARARIPIWWIDAMGAAPDRLLLEPRDLRAEESAPIGDKAKAALVDYLEQSVFPPAFAEPETNGPIERVAYRISRLLGDDFSPLNGYLCEEPPGSFFLWKTFNAMMDMIAPKRSNGASQETARATHVEQWWFANYAAADRLSLAYGDRYRSSYVLIAGLAFVALLSAALGGAFERVEAVGAVVEIVSLIGILTLVGMNYHYRWHEKWISYRLLAELCRKQCVLSSIGRSLPSAEVTRISLDSADAPLAAEDEDTLPREAWVAWYFTVKLRAAPFALGSFATAKPYALSTARALTQQQIDYHRERRRRNKAAGQFFGRFGQIFFLFILVAGGWKLGGALGGEGHKTVVEYSGAAGLALSALSGALVGVRAYSEFSLLSRQSTHMMSVMKETADEIEAIDIDQPLASRELGHKIYTLALAMMNEVHGWAQLFGIKTLETA